MSRESQEEEGERKWGGGYQRESRSGRNDNEVESEGVSSRRVIKEEGEEETKEEESKGKDERESDQGVEQGSEYRKRGRRKREKERERG